MRSGERPREELLGQLDDLVFELTDPRVGDAAGGFELADAGFELADAGFELVSRFHPRESSIGRDE